MSKYKKIEIDLIESIKQKTYGTDFFDVKQWSDYDAEILLNAGNFIKKQLTELEKKNVKKAKRVNIYTRYSSQPEYLKTWVAGIVEKHYYHVFIEGRTNAIIKMDGYSWYCDRMTGNKYISSKYYLINKNIKGMWTDKGKLVHEGRINKKIKKEFEKLLK